MQFYRSHCSMQIDIRANGTRIEGAPFPVLVTSGSLCAAASLPSTFVPPFQSCEPLTVTASEGIALDVSVRDCFGNPTTLSPEQVSLLRLQTQLIAPVPTSSVIPCDSSRGLLDWISTSVASNVHKEICVHSQPSSKSPHPHACLVVINSVCRRKICRAQSKCSSTPQSCKLSKQPI
jgi:hypothetical protein